ncbi:MAG: sulfite exporter TauE/SafE family protein [Candidatus Sungbacteria bacterium]|nr:sulfite exporter TauE/SafE family protein [Candidatus Sungbacteria bacterium]
MEFSLIVPAFIAGILTFLAPCTLPLVPGYLGFISGVSSQALQDPLKSKSARRKIFLNGLLFVIGFSFIFILLGSLFGLGGSALAQYRIWLSRIGGIFVILFGLFMIGVLRLPFLNVEKNIAKIKALRPGNPASSLIFGATFAFGWTPCVGPILGSILALAAASATVGQGAFLLSVFSLGLAMPFLIIAAGIDSASNYISKFSKYLNIISIIGGLFLVFLGILLLTNKLGVWIAYFYQRFYFINYERLLDYL